MAPVILFEFPSTKLETRSWVLDRTATLAIEGKAELKFVGTEQAGSGSAGTETIALEFESIDYANSTLSEWWRDDRFPDLMEMRVLQIESAALAGTIFP